MSLVVCGIQPSVNAAYRRQAKELAILTNLPILDADAIAIAQLYNQRWSIETLFQVVTENNDREITTLDYPPAALFSFSMALVAYNIMSSC